VRKCEKKDDKKNLHPKKNVFASPLRFAPANAHGFLCFSLFLACHGGMRARITLNADARCRYLFFFVVDEKKKSKNIFVFLSLTHSLTLFLQQACRAS
jgi:hypothetical protein